MQSRIFEIPYFLHARLKILVTSLKIWSLKKFHCSLIDKRSMSLLLFIFAKPNKNTQETNLKG